MTTKVLPSPGEVMRQAWAKVPKPVRMTFFSALVMGLVTHLYMWSNKIPNHDDIRHLFENDYGAQSGRWLLPYVSKLSGDVSMPWVIGVLSLVFLALSACLVVSLFRVKEPVFCAAIAALMVSFPTVASTFTYMFTADAYFLGLLLAVLAAYLAVRRPYAGVVFGTLALVLSMSIYQSYFPVAVALMLGALLFDTLAADRSFMMLVAKGVRLLVVLLLAMGGYLVCARLTTAKVGLVDYMGISSMGKLNPAELPALISKCYTEYWSVFVDDSLHVHFGFLKPLLLAAAVATLVLLLLLLWQCKLGVWRTLLALMIAALYPLGGNLIHIMVGGELVHGLMIYGMVLVLVLPLALASEACTHRDGVGIGMQNVRTMIAWFLLAVMSITSYSYVLADNRAYLKTELGFTQSMAYGNRLLSAIESCEGYKANMPVVFIGNAKAEPGLQVIKALEFVHFTGATSLADMRTNYSYNQFLSKYLAFYGDLYLEETQQGKAMVNHPQVQAMPCYPTQGAVKIIDGTVVVKFNEPL